MSNHVSEMVLTRNILNELGFVLPLDAKILDFGCGEGAAAYAYLNKGYVNVYGYDVKNYLNLQNPSDAHRFYFTLEDLASLNGTFDFIFSNQVFEHVMDYPQTIHQIYQLLKPGGISLHFFPSKWRLIEPHIYVPLAGAFSSRPYLSLWARLGIRNEFQTHSTWEEVAEGNHSFCKNQLNYLGSREIYQAFKAYFDRVEFREDLFIKHSPGRLKMLPKFLKLMPGLAAGLRTFHSRLVFLQKY
ncbi:MAG: class I SAM-dependent methyltransferase [Alphaproteobacteria bacterium]|nr:class I SAM-dependent methyltransferase [Alphaproteobacteria bacterium]